MKNYLRDWARSKRGKCRGKDGKDDNVCYEKLVSLLKNTAEYKQAKNIMLFYPLKNEVNLLSLLEDKTKNFYLPKIDGKNLLCCPYSNGDELCFSCFKTKEPLTSPVDKNLIDLVIVPALCCDKNNFRLGYGGGFYDRFLKDYAGKKVVCIPKEFIVNTIYPDSYDVAVDLVITY